ncbi:hypothetical protein XENTR_v10007293 [Xenopus tropicalis]|nr:hypothetical protein XENTR_v10007293 [Xenopus tropicalis]
MWERERQTLQPKAGARQREAVCVLLLREMLQKLLLHQCPVCSKCFSNKSVLIRHHKSHTGQRPFTCSYCEKCFSHRAGLLEHLSLHAGDRPYVCPECGKCFKYRASLTSHRRIHRGKSICV